MIDWKAIKQHLDDRSDYDTESSEGIYYTRGNREANVLSTIMDWENKYFGVTELDAVTEVLELFEDYPDRDEYSSTIEQLNRRYFELEMELEKKKDEQANY